jgi:hypothetical protein
VLRPATFSLKLAIVCAACLVCMGYGGGTYILAMFLGFLSQLVAVFSVNGVVERLLYVHLARARCCGLGLNVSYSFLAPLSLSLR